MSRVSKRQTTTEKTRKLERASAKNKTESPCGRKPAQIAAGDIVTTFLTTDGARHSPYRLRVTWPEVTEDIDGFPVTTIDRYIVHLQHSDDGVTWDPDYRRKVVDAKDGDDNTTAKAIFKGLRRNRYYRVRVRARDIKGCKSDLSDWTTGAKPTGTMVAPASITKERVGPRRIEFDWPDSTDPDFDRFKVEIYKADTSGGSYSLVRTRYVRHSYIAVHVSDTDKTKWWKIKVYAQSTVDAAGNRAESSATDSSADQADDVAGGGGRFTQVFTKNGTILDKLYKAKWIADGDYTIKRVRVVVGTHDPDTHPDGDGCPIAAAGAGSGTAIYVQVKKYDSDDAFVGNLFTSEGRLKVEAGTHKDTAWADDLNIDTIAEDEMLRVRVRSDDDITWLGEDLTVSIILEPR